MPLLGPEDVISQVPKRVLVAGTSGSGKTTLATQLAALLDAPHIEIDALFHGPGWTPNPQFVTAVDEFSSEPAWVTEWQYSSVRRLLAERADLLAWLDYPRTVVMRQIVRRTVLRRVRRQVLWNGNVEPPLWTIFNDPEHVVRWAWSTHRQAAERVGELMRVRPDLPVVRLASRKDTQEWLAGPMRAAANRRHQRGRG